jgi:hypothetical protein
MEIFKNLRSDVTPWGVVGHQTLRITRIRSLRRDPMTPEQTQLARRRLSLGIVNVGFWVMASICGLALIRSGRGPLDVMEIVTIVATALGFQAIFDALGGGLLMPGIRPTPGAFLKRWGRATIIHSSIVAVIGVVATASLHWTGGFCTGLAASTVALSVARKFLHAAIAGAEVQPRVTANGERLLATQVDDPAFTGGIVGFGSHAGILVPESWRQNLPEAELRTELSRRRWQADQGLPFRTVVVLLLWNLTGCQAGSLAFDFSSLTTGTALLGQACWMTLWSFLGLLVLPSLGRASVFAADRAVASAGLDPSRWIRRLPAITGEDGNDRRWVETIFYPIPSAARRLNSLGSPVRGPILGDLARSQLYYSLAGLTLLGRAVHCNVGRPALWVFPPSS